MLYRNKKLNLLKKILFSFYEYYNWTTSPGFHFI